MNIHCFFEQSGTFKNAFKNLGFNAYDYDILNDFNETDYIIDLFNEIDLAYLGEKSLFDSISKDDLVIAFFPCVRFSEQSYMLFQCTQKQLIDLSDLSKLEHVLTYHNELSYLYNLICKLCIVCIRKQIKLIIENPYSQIHYLVRYFPLKPKIIDIDRTRRGDNFKKPTQYWFINCEPSFNFISEACYVSSKKCVAYTSDKVERSLINPCYAARFIKEFIL